MAGNWKVNKDVGEFVVVPTPSFANDIVEFGAVWAFEIGELD
jgi:hypothetical protein